MIIGSLFDGIGTWQLSGERYGMHTVWSSEIDKFPMGVSKYHFPNTLQLGDIKNIDGSKIEPVDIICSGSPCQSFSIAGERTGFNGESSLFSEGVRIVREMRKATNGKYPRWFIWENVPGSFSSNGKRDFKRVLEEITQSEIPIPKSGRWAKSGMVRGRGLDVSWRVLDARFFGVPQRRARIFLVADFTGRGGSAEVLFKQESLPRDITQSKGTWKATSETTGECTDMPVLLRMRAGKEGGGKGALLSVNESLTLATNNDQTLFENHPQDSRVDGPLDLCPTVNARYGTGGCNIPLVLNDQGGKSINVNKDIAPIVYCVGNGQLDQAKLSKHTGALNCMHDQQAILVGCLNRDDYKGINNQYVQQNKVYIDKGAVRRLTPLECERLQGLPDGYTNVTINGKPASDSGRYKAIGNGMAVPCSDFIMRGIYYSKL